MSPVEAGLPHRAPFLFVDEILEVAEDKATARKVFPPEDPIFQGHFPGHPLVPGVLLVEALAQTAGAVLRRPGLLLCAISRMKFASAAGPGEEVFLEAHLAGELAGAWQFEVRASIGGRTVAEGRLVLGETEKP